MKRRLIGLSIALAVLASPFLAQAAEIYLIPRRANIRPA